VTRVTKKVYGYFGHHKCASTWFVQIFGEVCLELGLRYSIVNKSRDFDGDLRRYIKANDVDFIAYTNADFGQVAKLDNLVGVHAVRDPRDIVVSAYFSHLKTHATTTWPELAAHRLLLQQCDQETGLFHEIAFRQRQFEEMSSWSEYHADNIIQVRMEDVTSRTYQSMLSIVGFLGLLNQERYGFSKRLEYVFARLLRNIEARLGVPLPRILRALPAERMLGIVWQNEFEKLAGGRKIGEESKDSHYRKGVHGDWKNYLNGAHTARIRALCRDIMVQNGYEGSPGEH
jgi:hypothetical protein